MDDGLDGFVDGSGEEVRFSGVRSCFEGEPHASHTPKTLGSTWNFASAMTCGWKFLLLPRQRKGDT